VFVFRNASCIYLPWNHSHLKTVTFTNKDIDNPEAQGLLGDTRFLWSLEEKSREKQKKTNKVRNNDNSNYQLLHPIATIKIGSAGARLLRIDSHKLLDLMDHDERLESSFRLLLLKSLKLKIGNLLLAQQQQCQVNLKESDNCEGNVTIPSAKDDEQKENETRSLTNRTIC